MATSPVHSASLPVVAAGKISLSHEHLTNRVSKRPVWMVLTELSAVVALGTTLAKAAAEKIPYSPLDLKKTSSAGPEPCEIQA